MGEPLFCVCGRVAVQTTMDEPHEATVIRCPNAETCLGNIVFKPTERGARMAWSRVMREKRAAQETRR